MQSNFPADLVQFKETRSANRKLQVTSPPLRTQGGLFYLGNVKSSIAMSGSLEGSHHGDQYVRAEALSWVEVTNLKIMSSPYQARVIGLLRPLKDVTVTAGESATFDCELSYEGIPVEWFLKGKKLEPSDQVKKLNFTFSHVFSSSFSLKALPLLYFLFILSGEVLRHSNIVVLLCQMLNHP